MTADLDYVLGVWVAGVTAFGAFCTRLISRVSLVRHMASFVLQEIQDTTDPPLCSADFAKDDYGPRHRNDG